RPSQYYVNHPGSGSRQDRAPPRAKENAMSSQLESYDPEEPQSDREEEAVETDWSDSDIDELPADPPAVRAVQEASREDVAAQQSIVEFDEQPDRAECPVRASQRRQSPASLQANLLDAGRRSGCRGTRAACNPAVRVPRQLISALRLPSA